MEPLNEPTHHTIRCAARIKPPLQVGDSLGGALKPANEGRLKTGQRK